MKALWVMPASVFRNSCLVILPVISILLFSFDGPGKKKTIKQKVALTKKLPGESQYSIVIDKSDTLLKVYDAQGWFASYPIVFGLGGIGDKTLGGDKKTPEGKFRINGKANDPEWGAKLSLDYPNAESISKFNESKKKKRIPGEALIGCCIAIHGTRPYEEFLVDVGQNWTDGCVSLKYSDVQELSSYIPVGTSVTIIPAKKTTVYNEVAPEQHVNNSSCRKYKCPPGEECPGNGDGADCPGCIKELIKEGISTSDLASRILKKFMETSTARVMPKREVLRREPVNIVLQPEIKLKPAETTNNSYWNTVQLARNYFNNEDPVNAYKYYAEAFALNAESDLADTLTMLAGMIRYNSALDSATELKNSAYAHYNLSGITDVNKKVSVCEESIQLLEKAIIAYSKALLYYPKGGAPGTWINNCGKMMQKIKTEKDKFNTEIVAELFKKSKAKGIEANDNKNYPEALKAFEEAFGYLQNEQLQKSMFNFISDYEYIKFKVESLRLKLSIENTTAK